MRNEIVLNKRSIGVNNEYNGIILFPVTSFYLTISPIQGTYMESTDDIDLELTAVPDESNEQEIAQAEDTEHLKLDVDNGGSSNRTVVKQNVDLGTIQNYSSSSSEESTLSAIQPSDDIGRNYDSRYLDPRQYSYNATLNSQTLVNNRNVQPDSFLIFKQQKEQNQKKGVGIRAAESNDSNEIKEPNRNMEYSGISEKEKTLTWDRYDKTQQTVSEGIIQTRAEVHKVQSHTNNDTDANIMMERKSERNRHDNKGKIKFR